MLVPLERIHPYDRNPRQEPNEAYDRIKQSILSRGLTGSLPITRRPGEPDYMVAEGGNTVLQIVKELYAETGDPRFQAIHCLFEPWVSESATLIAHLVENDARGELMFIDRARAVHELRRLLEQETPAVYSRPASSRHSCASGGMRSIRSRSGTSSTPLKRCYPSSRGATRRHGASRRRSDPQAREDARHLPGAPQVRPDPHRGGPEPVSGLCLSRHDCEDWVLDPVRRELETHMAEFCGESLAKVRADFELIEQHGAPGPDAPPPEPLTQAPLLEPSRTRAPSPVAFEKDPTRTPRWPAGSRRDMNEDFGQEPEIEPRTSDLPATRDPQGNGRDRSSAPIYAAIAQGVVSSLSRWG